MNHLVAQLWSRQAINPSNSPYNRNDSFKTELFPFETFGLNPVRTEKPLMIPVAIIVTTTPISQRCNNHSPDVNIRNIKDPV
jgi:hypothetical protein